MIMSAFVSPCHLSSSILSSPLPINNIVLNDHITSVSVSSFICINMPLTSEEKNTHVSKRTLSSIVPFTKRKVSSFFSTTLSSSQSKSTCYASATFDEKHKNNISESITKTKLSSSFNTVSRSDIFDEITVTWLDFQSFILRCGDTSILIDPWLTGDIQFDDPQVLTIRRIATPFESVLKTLNDVSNSLTTKNTSNNNNISAILITHNQPDHLHKPTLELFNRNIPIIAPLSSRSQIQSLSFKQCHFLQCDHGRTCHTILSDRLSIRAFHGSRSGLFGSVQLASMIEIGNKVIYFEPHAQHDLKYLKNYQHQVDVILSPYQGLKAKLLGPLNINLIGGPPNLAHLCQLLKPQSCIVYDLNRHEIKGKLMDSFIPFGTLQDLNQQFQDRNLDDIKIFSNPGPLQEFVVTGQHAGSIVM